MLFLYVLETKLSKSSVLTRAGVCVGRYILYGPIGVVLWIYYVANWTYWPFGSPQMTADELELRVRFTGGCHRWKRLWKNRRNNQDCHWCFSFNLVTKAYDYQTFVYDPGFGVYVSVELGLAISVTYLSLAPGEWQSLIYSGHQTASLES